PVTPSPPTTPPATDGACGKVYTNTDFQGADLTTVPGTSPEDCCPKCAANPVCTGFSFAQATCYLKFGPLTRVENAWGVSTAVLKAIQPSQQCFPPEVNVDYNGNDVARDASVTTTDGCCALCAANAACQLYVVSKFGCSLKSKAENRQTGLDPSWNVRAAFRANAQQGTTLTTSTYTPNIRVAPLTYTTMSGSQWFVNSNLESTGDDELDALLVAINETKHAHAAKPESIIAPGADGSKVFPFTSVASVGECAALVSSIDQKYFTYLASSGVCLGHEYPGADKTYLLQANNQPAVAVQKALGDSLLLKPSVPVANDAACVDKCKATSKCMAARTVNGKCSVYGPAIARSASTFAGYVTTPFVSTPVPNLPTFGNPSKVHFYTTAHQDDHELFMSNIYHKSIADPSTKVVFVYTTSGDDHGGNKWRQARELGTLSTTSAWVDHMGKFNSAPKGDTVNISGRQIARVTIGNVVSYFLRIPEYGNDGNTGFMALINGERPVAPMDAPDKPYANRDAFKQVLAAIYANEAQGIRAIELNAQDPDGEMPDHAMHLATGQLVWDIVNANAQWKTCAPQHYYFDYQRWLDPVNVGADVVPLQRYAWMRMSQAIYNYDNTILFWSEHSINLGRTYIRRTFNEGAGPC
ncbi:hypothetical protein As57867_008707, partial [Aphanomyces stellatus]